MKRGKYPSKQTVNLAACGRKAEDKGPLLQVFFVCLILLGITAGSCIIWPFWSLEQCRAELRERKAQLAGYQEYNEDYRQTEQRYGQYFRTYLTEEEAGLAKRGEVVRLLEEKTDAYGGMESIEIRDNSCRVVIGEVTLSRLSVLTRELKTSPLIEEITVSTSMAAADEGDEAREQAVTAVLEIMLSEPETEGAFPE